MQLAYSSQEAHPVVQRLLEDQLGSLRIATDIHLEDEMFHFAMQQMHGYRDLALLHYFRGGLAALTALRQITDQIFGDRKLRLLDFASGHGRVTRFLVQAYPSSVITVSDIVPEAVAFQRHQFGVAGLDSAAEPEDLVYDGRFDCITVLSLFSHLPLAAFKAWLRRLLQLVEPGGCLIFSTHGEATCPPGTRMPPEGFLFEGRSESRVLDPGQYGSTWVDERFVRGALREACSEPWSCIRLPRALWHLQDLYVVGKALQLPALAYSGGPEGYLEKCILEGRTRLYLSGWAADRGQPSAPPLVSVFVNGERVQDVAPSLVRPDVTAFIAQPEVEVAGWEVTCEPLARPFSQMDELLVKAKSRDGVDYVIHLSTILGATLFHDIQQERVVSRQEIASRGDRIASLQQELARAQEAVRNLERTTTEQRRELEQLRATIDCMQASRFWKLRNRWFSLKSAIRRLVSREPAVSR